MDESGRSTTVDGADSGDTSRGVDRTDAGTRRASDSRRGPTPSSTRPGDGSSRRPEDPATRGPDGRAARTDGRDGPPDGRRQGSRDGDPDPVGDSGADPLGPFRACLPAATAGVGAVGVVLVGVAPYAGWPPDWLPAVPGGTRTVLAAVAAAAAVPTFLAVYGHDRVRVAKTIGVATVELGWLAALIGVPFAIDPDLLGLFPGVVIERLILPALVVATALGVITTALLGVLPVAFDAESASTTDSGGG